MWVAFSCIFPGFGLLTVSPCFLLSVAPALTQLSVMFSTVQGSPTESIYVIPFSCQFLPVVFFFLPQLHQSSCVMGIFCLIHRPSLTFFFMSSEIVCVDDRRDREAYLELSGGSGWLGFVVFIRLPMIREIE